MLDEGYVTALNKVTTAEIFIPIERKGDFRQFAGIDLSRETFGKIYKSLLSANGKFAYNEFDLYDKLKIENSVSFTTFFACLCVFEELDLVRIEENGKYVVWANKNKKNPLENSKLFQTLTLLKKSQGK